MIINDHINLRLSTYFAILIMLDEMDDDGESASSQNRPDDADSSPFWQLMDVVLTPADGQGEELVILFQTGE
jgi:hypothetical protein